MWSVWTTWRVGGQKTSKLRWSSTRTSSSGRRSKKTCSSIHSVTLYIFRVDYICHLLAPQISHVGKPPIAMANCPRNYSLLCIRVFCCANRFVFRSHKDVLIELGTPSKKYGIIWELPLLQNFPPRQKNGKKGWNYPKLKFLQVHNNQAWKGGGKCFEAKQHARPRRNVFWGSCKEIRLDELCSKLKWFEIQDVEPAMDVHKKMVLDINGHKICCSSSSML